MKQQVKTIPDGQKYISCEQCNEKYAHNMSGLFGGSSKVRFKMSFGPWFCHRCGYGTCGKLLDDGTIETRLIFPEVRIGQFSVRSFDGTKDSGILISHWCGERMQCRLEGLKRLEKLLDEFWGKEF